MNNYIYIYRNIKIILNNTKLKLNIIYVIRKEKK